MKKTAVLFLTGILIITALGGCRSANADQARAAETRSEEAAGDTTEDVTVTLGYLPITHALAEFQEKELLDEADMGVHIELQKFSSWTDLMDALNAGRIDGASVLVELAMNAVSQGIDLNAIALGHRDGNVIVAANDIDTVEDLKGKTFAIPSNQSSHNILMQDMLKEAGISTDEIEITQLAPSEMPSSLASGAIAGYCVAEPFGAQAVVQGYGKVLYHSEDLWEDSLCCAFVLNNQFIEENEKAVEVLRKYYTKAGESLDKERAEAIAEEYLGQDKETLEASLSWIHYDDLEISEEDYQVLTEKVTAYGINENPPSYDTFVYNIPVKE